jgi:cell pole-organizing protein PopZ
MTQAAKAQEPSMEEILASIRRIIADDDAKGPPAAPEPARASPEAAAPWRSVPAAAPGPAFVPAPPASNGSSINETMLDEMLAGLNAAPAAAADAAEEKASDVRDPARAPATPASPSPSGFRSIDGQSDIAFEDSPPEHFAEPAAAHDRPRQQFSERGERPLMSSATTAAVNSAFNTLAHTVLVQNARTLEDLVREMLHPLLKSWLEDNLPRLVERLVKAEIERVSRGRS